MLGAFKFCPFPFSSWRWPQGSASLVLGTQGWGFLRCLFLEPACWGIFYQWSESSVCYRKDVSKPGLLTLGIWGPCLLGNVWPGHLHSLFGRVYSLWQRCWALETQSMTFSSLFLCTYIFFQNLCLVSKQTSLGPAVGRIIAPQRHRCPWSLWVLPSKAEDIFQMWLGLRTLTWGRVSWIIQVGPVESCESWKAGNPSQLYSEKWHCWLGGWRRRAMNQRMEETSESGKMEKKHSGISLFRLGLSDRNWFLIVLEAGGQDQVLFLACGWCLFLVPAHRVSNLSLSSSCNKATNPQSCWIRTPSLWPCVCVLSRFSHVRLFVTL